MLKLAAAVILGSAIVAAGSMEYQDEIREQDLYCEMVGSGAWGDYRGNYAEVCSTERPGDAPEEEGSEDEQSDGETAIVYGQQDTRGIRGDLHS